MTDQDHSEAPAPSGRSGTLVLVPTELERRRVLDHGGIPAAGGQLHLCGFGPVAAAARTAQLLADLRPERVLLLGIAGAYDTDRWPVESALEFEAVAVEGIGVGEGRELLPPPALGFPQWPGSTGESGGETSSSAHLAPIYDALALAAGGPRAEPRGATNPTESCPRGRWLLTTCAASSSPDQAAVRRERFPEADAEDMEGFAVATSCALFHTPLRIVRGISNRVGDREVSNWRIPGALASARRAAMALLEEPAPWRPVDASVPLERQG